MVGWVVSTILNRHCDFRGREGLLNGVQGRHLRGRVGNVGVGAVKRRAVWIVVLVQDREEAAEADGQQVCAVDVDGLLGGAEKHESDKSADDGDPAHVEREKTQILVGEHTDGVVRDGAVEVDRLKIRGKTPWPALDEIDGAKGSDDGCVRHQDTQDHKIQLATGTLTAGIGDRVGATKGRLGTFVNLAEAAVGLD